VTTTDTVLLGLIAAGVLLMAGGQVTAVIMAIRATRRVGDTLNRLEDSIRPIVSNVQQMSEDAARATAIATAQVAKAERMMDDVSRKIDETMDMVQHTILAPARNGMAMLEGLKAAFGAFFGGGNSGRRRSPRPASVAEDDASFIG
jgi:outer membrane murein-binding lipoprotein Lpp